MRGARGLQMSGLPKKRDVVSRSWHVPAAGTWHTSGTCHRWHVPDVTDPACQWHEPDVPDPAVPVARGTAGAGVWHEVAHGTAHSATSMITTITTATVAIVKRHQ